MFDNKLFERMQELANIKEQTNKELPEEDELNYYVYELLEDGDVESKAKRESQGYSGYIKFILAEENFTNDKYNLDDIFESLSYEKNLYVDYIKHNMDISFLVEGDLPKIIGYKAVKEDNNLFIFLKYRSKILYS